MKQSIIIAPDKRPASLSKISDLIMRMRAGSSVLVEISEYKKRRSDEQNRYLWGVCYQAIQDATGQEAKDWHEYFLGEWSGWETYAMFGQKRKRPKRRSSKLNKLEFSDYVAFIQRRCSENGIYIPDPE